MAETDTFQCPECGQVIRARHPSIIWHLLNKWHNPFNAYINAMRAGMPLREIIGFTLLGLLVGTGLVALLIWIID